MIVLFGAVTKGHTDYVSLRRVLTDKICPNNKKYAIFVE